MKPLKLLVVIVTYNGRRWLDRCLGSVHTWKPDGSALSAVDLFVVDNASTDGSADFVASEFPEAILVRNDRNLGFGKANNIGMRYALEKGYDYVYLMNQDAWINEITLGRLVRYAENDEDYGVLSPLQFRADGERLDRLFEKRFRSTPDEVYDHSVVEVPFIMAAHWLLPRRTLETVGLFDEIFTHNVGVACEALQHQPPPVGALLLCDLFHPREVLEVWLDASLEALFRPDPHAAPDP